MTQTITKNFVAVAFVAALFSILLAMPQASEAKVNISDIRMSVKDRVMASSTATSTKPDISLSCVQGAVGERETAIIGAWGEFNTSITAALTARKEGLQAAWGNTATKDRSSLLKDVWATWKSESKKAHSTLKADRKAAWAEFKKTMKEECRDSKLPKEDAEPKDANGAVTL